MSFAVPTYVKRGSAILAIFVFWFVFFGTVKVKHQTNYKNYAHCIRYNPQADNNTEQDIKRLSRMYNISSEKVETLVQADQKSYEYRTKHPILKRDFQIGNVKAILSAPPPQYIDFGYEREKKKLTFKQKVDRAFSKYAVPVIEIYFKVVGISFSRKPCK